jgi:hypothetical protein
MPGDLEVEGGVREGRRLAINGALALGAAMLRAGAGALPEAPAEDTLGTAVPVVVVMANTEGPVAAIGPEVVLGC